MVTGFNPQMWLPFRFGGGESRSRTRPRGLRVPSLPNGEARIPVCEHSETDAANIYINRNLVSTNESAADFGFRLRGHNPPNFDIYLICGRQTSAPAPSALVARTMGHGYPISSLAYCLWGRTPTPPPLYPYNSCFNCSSQNFPKTRGVYDRLGIRIQGTLQITHF